MKKTVFRIGMYRHV